MSLTSVITHEGSSFGYVISSISKVMSTSLEHIAWTCGGPNLSSKIASSLLAELLVLGSNQEVLYSARMALCPSNEGLLSFSPAYIAALNQTENKYLFMSAMLVPWMCVKKGMFLIVREKSISVWTL